MIHFAERIEMWPVERLKPYEKNARTHTEDQVSQIAASITEFGFTNPILVDGSDGVIAGHGRLEAAKRLGLKEVPVIELTHLSPKQKRAYIIADNKLALNAGWDMAILSEEMEDLRDFDFDLNVIGFSDEELEALFSANEDPEDGYQEQSEDVKDEPADVMIVVGEYRVKVTREEYLDFIENLRQKVGFDKDSIEAEIRRRLKV